MRQDRSNLAHMTEEERGNNPPGRPDGWQRHLVWITGVWVLPIVWILRLFHRRPCRPARFWQLRRFWRLFPATSSIAAGIAAHSPTRRTRAKKPKN
jgi:hypothetical protein